MRGIPGGVDHTQSAESCRGILFLGGKQNFDFFVLILHTALQ